jgi:hypothetical protein
MNNAPNLGTSESFGIINDRFKVNQRGLASYTDGVGLDGWEGRAGQTISQLSYLNSVIGVRLVSDTNGIWFNCIPEGNLVDFIGQTVTLSCGYAVNGGAVHRVASGTGIVSPYIAPNAADIIINAIRDVTDQYSCGMVLGNYADYYKMILIQCGADTPAGTEFWIEWVKLELGDKFTGPPPERDPAVELAECRRRYIPLAADSAFAGIVSNSYSIVFDVGQDMRRVPNLINNGISVRTPDGAAVGGFAFSTVIRGSITQIVATKTNHGLINAFLYIDAASGLSAD